MDELVPVVLGILLGAPVWHYSSGLLRTALSVLAVAVSGAAATIISGEYLESYVYLLLDLGEAAAGLVIGFMIAHLVQRKRDRRILSSARP
jgi:hypothetical protein